MPTSRRTLLKSTAATAACCRWTGRGRRRSRGRPYRRDLRHDRPVRGGGSVASSVGTQLPSTSSTKRAASPANTRSPRQRQLPSKPMSPSRGRTPDQPGEVDIILGVFVSARPSRSRPGSSNTRRSCGSRRGFDGRVQDKNLRYVFRGQIHSDQYGQAFAGFLAKHAKGKLGVEPKDVKIALIHEDGPYGVGVGVRTRPTQKRPGSTSC